jgi:hypothetical protein
LSVIRAFVPWVLFVALAVHFGSHVAIVIGLARERAFVRAAIALIISPLAPYWGWKAGMRRRVIVWSTALALYALGVIVA